MGLEAVSTGKNKGKALLETSELIFRGEGRVVIPFASITSAEAKRGRLVVKHAKGSLTLEIGPQAEKWALKIRYPKPVIEKLGVKPGLQVGIVGNFAETFLERVRERAAISKSDCDILFLAAEDLRALDQLTPLQKKIKRNGAIWVVYPKGQKHIREADVLAAGKAHQLVDVKVVGFSETHSSLKMVIPVARR